MHNAIVDVGKSALYTRLSNYLDRTPYEKHLVVYEISHSYQLFAVDKFYKEMNFTRNERLQ